MGKWAGKYVIGLTGNIATGKSLVRRMLEQLGALGIDADLIAHRAIAPGAPGYQAVISTFGRYILNAKGEIDRSRLASIVFSDPHALLLLEQIVHPLVEQAIDLIISRTSKEVIVIEAIKLLEAGLGEKCDSIWVSHAPPEVQVERLVQNRGLSQAEALQRISAQPPQELKLAAAQIVIHNDSNIDETFRQVTDAWNGHIPFSIKSVSPTQTEDVAFTVRKGATHHATQISDLINRVTKSSPALHGPDILAGFGEKTYLLLLASESLVGLLVWQVENLIACVTDMLIDSSIPFEKALPPLVAEMERASGDLQCKAALIFANPQLANQDYLFNRLGYSNRAPTSLEYAKCPQAVLESMPHGSVVYFKDFRANQI